LRILVSGFGPFGDFFTNPSDQLAGYLSGRYEEVEHISLPVAYVKARDLITEKMTSSEPDAVVAFGLNPKIGHFNLEEIALNLRSAEIADNNGILKKNEPINDNGPLALRSSLPLDPILKNMRDGRVPSKRSYSAGVYICNEIFYTILEYCEAENRMGGFIHIPMASEMIAGDPRRYGSPHMSMDMIKRGGEIIIETLR
jgi:pyroglutamyl-peptidase